MFKRCCFCLPLRYGLLAWGYFKMTADAFVVTILTYLLKDTLMTISIFRRHDFSLSRLYYDVIIVIIANIIFFTDFVVTIVFLVGGHKKNVKLIRVFYIHSIGMWVITYLFSVKEVVTTIQTLMAPELRYWVRIVLASFFFVALAVQSYFLLLLRSEIIKLRNNGEFRFVNNAAEAECTMICEEKAVEEETVNEVVIN